jgi:hypothetical protein
MKRFVAFGSAAVLSFSAICTPSAGLAKPSKSPPLTLADVCQQIVDAGYFSNSSDPLVSCIEYVSAGDPVELCSYAKDDGLLEYLGLTKGDCVSKLKQK